MMIDTVWLKDFGRRRALEEAEARLSIALQPIVDAASGKPIAAEALMRGFADMGFASPNALLDHAFSLDQLLDLDLLLLGKALAIHARVPAAERPLLFVNLDGRNLPHWRAISDFLRTGCELGGLHPFDICIELSEAHQPLPLDELERAVDTFRRIGFQIALDDFGNGTSGLQMLYQTSPDFLKIDRFFIGSMPDDPKKRRLVSTIVDLAHTLGSRVIAEGIETPEELACCREVGCDLIQGFLIGRPSTDPATVSTDLSPRIEALALSAPHPEDQVMSRLLEEVAVLSCEDSLRDLFDLAAANPAQTVFPVIDRRGIPVGAVRERDFKALLHSRYGRDLACNTSLRLRVMDYARPIATVECAMPLAPRLELIAERAGDGVVVTSGLRYRGFLSSTSLLRLSNAIRLRQAAAQNPLTHLPGNDAIRGFLERCVAEPGSPRLAAYLDIDNFKPFNDKYGFEVGDRALMMLATILKSLERDHGLFVGHIGGDDFFIGAEGNASAQAQQILSTIGARFRHVAESLYDEADRAAGFMSGRARDGSPRQFPLMSCTVAMLRIGAADRPQGTLDITARLTATKADARRRGLPVAIADLMAGDR
ncbi:EAL domain-containing protein [Cereibacter johrii]|uniref:EAL domain-containing protein n=1 Tax=Cereibacter johrii TaxID=445629 RepID=UPI000DCB5121|nr:EAL domain-containing protein [Cereibacter johrii]RAZ82899.1 hypothetical protein DDV93_17695 [Cereibacter johrii]